MNKLNWFLTGYLLLVALAASANQTLEKIIVTDTNNFRLGREFTGLNIPESAKNPHYDGLRSYYQPPHTGKNELQDILAVAKWVHLRWAHDPFGSSAPKTDALTLLKTIPPGSGFSCNEYSKVLRDLLRANGYISRSITLQSSDISYGGLGSSHVAVEVFINQLNKWMLVDAQWGFYPVHKDIPLNAYDIFELKKDNKFNEVKFVSFSNSDKVKLQQDLTEYKMFLADYFGYITVELMADAEKVNVIYAMEGKEWPMTFQALPRNAQIFTDRSRDIYFDLNRVSLVLRYKNESQRLQKMQLDFSSAQDYLDKMPQFAAVPDFIVTPHNNMPWFDYYEYRIDGKKWNRLTDASFAWNLKKGANQLEVRAVNQLNRAGQTTFIKIRYQ